MCYFMVSTNIKWYLYLISQGTFQKTLLEVEAIEGVPRFHHSYFANLIGGQILTNTNYQKTEISQIRP